MNRMLIYIIAAILLIPMIIFGAGRWRLNQQTAENIRTLKASTVDISEKIYKEEQLKGLPDPVIRYFKYALSDGQAYISSVQLKHDGYFKTGLDKEWIEISGEQYFSAEEPGFLWKGKTSLFTVSDLYIAGKGKIIVTLLNLFTIVNGEGYKYDQGELLRWLGESVWFPTNLLPGDRLSWSAIDEDTAKLIFKYNEQELSYKVRFDKNGAITQLETIRYMGEEDLETWIGRVSDYQLVGGMKIPMNIEALWKLDNVEHSYAKFKVREIQHN